MNLEAIAQFLEVSSIGVRGESIFINAMPSEKNGILLKEYLPTAINWELPGYRKTSYQIISRAGRYEDAKTKINAAIAVLNYQGERVVGSLAFKYMRQRTEPISYPTSVGEKVEFACTIDCCYVIL